VWLVGERREREVGGLGVWLIGERREREVGGLGVWLVGERRGREVGGLGVWLVGERREREVGGLGVWLVGERRGREVGGLGVWPIGERRDMRTWLWMENLNVSNFVEDLGIYGSMILKCISKRIGGISWIYLAQGRDIWWDNLNMVMILLFP